MRRVLVMTLVAMICVFASVAQTQTGYVKTKGRQGANGKVIAGTRIAEATIQAKGSNAVRSNKNGVFSIPIPSSKYHLQSVKKNGYTLLDPDILLKVYFHSSNPLIIVMVSPEQKADDKLTTERQLRRTLEQRLHTKEEALELLKQQNKVTQEEYRKTLEALYKEQDKNGRLISDMAEHYANVDYDQLDAFNQQVSAYILDGELVKADSMLRSKGDVDSRIAKIHEQEAAQANERAEIAQRQANLELSIAGTQSEKADVAQDCYNFFKKFVIESQHDSAALYIEKRANLDQQNMQWQFDASRYFQNRGETAKAVLYNQRALELARAMAKVDPDHEGVLAMALNNAATLYMEQGRKAEAVGMYNEALAIFKRLAAENPETYDLFVASTLNNIAISSTDIDQSEALFNEAIDIYWRYALDDAATYIPQVASVLSNLGLLYDENQYEADSEEMYQNALGIYRRLAESHPATYLPNVAATLNNLSSMYHRYSIRAVECEQMQKEAAQIYRDLASEDPQLYYPQLGVILTNMAKQYNDAGRNAEGEEAFDQALEVYRWLTDDKAFIYKPQLGKMLFEQAIRMYKVEKLDKSEQLFTEALGIYRDLASVSPQTYLPDEAKLLRNIARILDRRQQWAESEKMYQEELAINKQLAQEDPDSYRADVARTWGNLSNHALLMKQFDKAMDYAREGLACDSSKLFIWANLAASLLFKGDYGQAEAIYRQYRTELKATFLDDLEEFERLGIIPKERETDVQRIRQMLQQQ